MTKPTLFTPVLIAGGAVLMLGVAIRASFGMLQIQLPSDFGWPRSDFFMAIVGRATSPENRALSLGIATAEGSGGQIVGAPTAELLLQHDHWQTVFGIFAVAIVFVLLALPVLKAQPKATKGELHESLGTVLLRALIHLPIGEKVPVAQTA